MALVGGPFTIVTVSNRTLKVWWVIFAVGVSMVIASYLPLMNPEQCPMHFSQAEVDSSNCIIGANIGAALARLAGITIALIGGLGSLVLLGVRVVRGTQ